MKARRRHLIVLLSLGAAAAIITTGCATGPEAQRLNVPPQGEYRSGGPVAGLYASMVDNALLSEMSVTDMHFVPHSTELNGAGVRRLTRYAELLELYGGTIHLATSSTDEEEIAAKVAHIRDFLAATGRDVSRIEVLPGRSQGTGMPAADALKIMEAGTSPKEEDSGPGPGVFVVGSGQ